MAGTRMCGPAHLRPHRLHDGWMAMAQQQRPVAGPVVDQVVAVHVPLMSALGPIDVDRKRLQVTEVMCDPAGKQPACFLIQAARGWKSGRVALVQGISHSETCAHCPFLSFTCPSPPPAHGCEAYSGTPRDRH